MSLKYTLRETEQTACSRGQVYLLLYCVLLTHATSTNSFRQETHEVGTGAFARPMGMLYHLLEASHPEPNTYQPAYRVGRVEGQGSIAAGS